MKCIVLDLEFTELVPDEDLEKSNLQIACAATLLSDYKGPPLLWTPDANVCALTLDILVHLIAYLEAMTSVGYTLVTWGGMGSDFRVLQKEVPHLRDTIRKLAMNSVDVPFVSASCQGMMMSLSAAAEAIGISEKEADSSKMIPQMWQSNMRDAVHDHVSRDVRLTMEVFTEICRTKLLKWKTQRGFIRTWAFQFKSVKECLQMPKPDVPFDVAKHMDPKYQSRWI